MNRSAISQMDIERSGLIDVFAKRLLCNHSCLSLIMLPGRAQNKARISWNKTEILARVWGDENWDRRVWVGGINVGFRAGDARDWPRDRAGGFEPGASGGRSERYFSRGAVRSSAHC